MLSCTAACSRLLSGHVCRAAGFDAVLGAEYGHQVNTGQLASVKGYGMWEGWGKVMEARAKEGVTFPVDATGPMALSTAVKVRRRVHPSSTISLDAPRPI
jgi:hypothetical protein